MHLCICYLCVDLHSYFDILKKFEHISIQVPFCKLKCLKGSEKVISSEICWVNKIDNVALLFELVTNYNKKHKKNLTIALTLAQSCQSIIFTKPFNLMILLFQSLNLPLTQNVAFGHSHTKYSTYSTVYSYIQYILCIAAFSTVAERYCKAPTTIVQGPLAFEHCSGRVRSLVQAKHRVVVSWLCVRKGSRAPTLTSKIHLSVPPLFSPLPLYF